MARMIKLCKLQVIAFAGLAVIGACSNAAAGDGLAEQPHGARLPGNIRPLAYRLDLRIVPDEARFSGRVEIDVSLSEPLREAWLHGRDLAMKSVSARVAGAPVIVGSWRQQTADGRSRLVFERTLPAGPATLAFDYDAPFGRGLRGLYKVTVGDDDYAFTQLEAISARRVFPSFDEPEYKTPFDIKVTSRSSYRVLGNTRAVETTALDGGMTRVRFARTLPLPTYLIAFAVGPLDVVEWAPIPASDIRPEPLPLRGVATRGQGPRLAYALGNTTPLVLALEDYFGIAYPFDKLDFVAVPDFAGGAMENAGLITYREPIVLLGDPPPESQVRLYTLIHTHELAHQWFGNLVTMPWWDDIWLNEAFASWMEAKIAHPLAPDYRYDRYIQAEAIEAMAEDSLVVARQVREPVNSTADIANAFDSITYDKGAGVLQMIERYIGPDIFRDGIRRHMRRFRFDTATVFDLMDSLDEAAGTNKRVRAAFGSFLFQPGVPYLEVRSICDNDSARLAIRQQRYLPLGSTGDADRSWIVPFCYAWGADGERREACTLIDAPDSEAGIDGACPDWLMPNAGGAGYFRWRLDAESLDRLAQAFPDALTAAERMAFADSLYAGVRQGSIPLSRYLELLPMMLAVPERSVIELMIDSYRELLLALRGTGQEEAATAYARNLFQARLAALDRPGGAESLAEGAILRYRLTQFLAIDLRAPALRNELNRKLLRFIGYPENPGEAKEPDANALEPDLLRPALIVAAQENGPRFIDFLREAFVSSKDALFRQYAMAAFAHVDDPGPAAEIRALVLGPDVRGNELQSWLYWSLNDDVVDSAWPWMRQNLDAVFEVATGRAKRNAPENFARGLCTADDAEALGELLASRTGSVSGLERKLAAATEKIRLCVAFREARLDQARRFFSAPRDSAAAGTATGVSRFSISAPVTSSGTATAQATPTLTAASSGSAVSSAAPSLMPAR